jgi:hypothetical protein
MELMGKAAREAMRLTQYLGRTGTDGAPPAPGRYVHER